MTRQWEWHEKAQGWVLSDGKQAVLIKTKGGEFDPPRLPTGNGVVREIAAEQSRLNARIFNSYENYD